MFKVEAIGNLGADAVVKATDKKPFISFRVAHSDRWTDSNGVEHNITTWLDCIINDADSKILPYLKQGVKVFVRGNARLDVYSSEKERRMKAKCTVSVQDVELCGGSSDEVPRMLIVPETGETLQISKHYHSGLTKTGLKKDQTRELIDQRGNKFIMDSVGFVKPVPVQDDTQEVNNQDSAQ